MAQELKVSIIVATYGTGAKVDDLIATVEQQTMSRDEFELIAADDGSKDDTFARLTEASETRPWLKTFQIENSGWPGRPRNLAMEMARGEYVFFIDHDDELFPEALERMYAAARTFDADVLAGKEVVQGWSSPGWPTWRRPSGTVPYDRASVQCITPHKLYRTAFLRKNSIKFPEGKVRLEDFDFNGQAWSKTEKFALLSDYPCYKWIIYDNNSHKAGFDWTVYWNSFDTSLEPIRSMSDGKKKDILLCRWYGSRIIERCGAQFAGRSDKYKAQMREVVERFSPDFPEAIDRFLTPADRARSALVRAGDDASLTRLAYLDKGLKTVASVSSLEWRDGMLRITGEARILDAARNELSFVEEPDGTIARVLDEDLDEILGSANDYSAVVDSAVAEVIVRDRKDSVDWSVPGDFNVQFVKVGEGRLRLRAAFSVTVDPATAAGGRRMNPEIWDVFFRLDGTGLTPTSRVPFGAAKSFDTSTDRPRVAYATKNGFLALDLGEKLYSFVDVVLPGQSEVRVRRAAAGSPLREAAKRVRSLVGVDPPRTSGRFSVSFPLTRSLSQRVAAEPAFLLVGKLQVPARVSTESGSVFTSDSFAVKPGIYPLRARIRSKDSSQIGTLVVSPQLDAFVMKPGIVDKSAVQ